MNAFKKIAVLAFTIAAMLLSVGSAFAYHYNYYPNYYGYAGPIYASGYYYSTYNYGWSGWGYNRVYYNYHYPYSTYNYYNYPSYGYGGPWMMNYAYRSYPMYVAYPFPGYYW